MVVLTPPIRRVRQVHLQAPTTDLVWRGRLLLEDAFHTATLPQAESPQLWLVRQLDLGYIYSHQSSATLALSLEEKVARLSKIALHGSQPSASYHPVVYFYDILDACVTLALRLACNQPIQAWFWPLIIRDYQPHSSAHDTFLAILNHLAQTPATALAIANLLVILQQHHSLRTLLSLLTEEDGAYLLTFHGWTQTHRQTSVQTLPIATVRTTQHQSLLAAACDFLPWSADDPRSLWFITLMLLYQHPTWSNQPQLLVESQAILSQLSQPEQTRTPLTPEENYVSGSEENSTLPTPSSNLPSPLAPNPPAPASRKSKVKSQKRGALRGDSRGNLIELARVLNLQTYITPSLPTPPTSPTPPASPTPSASPAFSALSFTHYAGLLFTLPLLYRLGLPKRSCLILAEFPYFLLPYLATRLDCDIEDAMLMALPQSQLPPPDPWLLTAWYSALRQGCRRFARMTLLELIHRPGEVMGTPTHIDVFFDLNQTDIRIRKAGLDLNPGWLPWFGRVVQFHYCSSQ